MQKYLQSSSQKASSLRSSSISAASQSSTISRNSRNKSVVTSQLMQVKKAPVTQFTKYLDDTQNVFYQDRYALKRLKQINQNKPVIRKLAIYLFCSFLVIYCIDKYQKQCPQNAWCGAYVHCNENFILTESQICSLDPQIIQTAVWFVQSIISNIKYNKGNEDCWGPHYSPLTNNLNKILDQQMIQNKQLRNQIWRQFSDINNQKSLKFNLNSNGDIDVQQTQHSLSCKFYLFSQTKLFILFVSLAILLFIAIYFYDKKRKFNKKAKQIYHFLHESVKKNHIISVKEQLKKYQLKHHKIDLNSELWILVDSIRVKHAQIVYFQDIDLKWKLLI